MGAWGGGGTGVIGGGVTAVTGVGVLSAGVGVLTGAGVAVAVASTVAGGSVLEQPLRNERLPVTARMQSNRERKCLSMPSGWGVEIAAGWRSHYIGVMVATSVQLARREKVPRCAASRPRSRSLRKLEHQ